MELRVTNRPFNIFVVGDIVVDHAIFVVNKTKPYHPRANEDVFDVRRRVNTAGGAANAARILGALNRGNTYLWGVTGRSLWGAFSDVLEASEVSDVGASKVIVTGFHDHTARMNTITRVLQWDDASQAHRARFDDVGSIGPTRTAAESLLDQLRAVHADNRLDAIVLNDLDMNALDADLIKDIANFAHGHGIPLFVDPKRNFRKYEGITATAIFPNIEEWCELVGEQRHGPSWWHKEIERPEGLKKLAERSLERLSAFEYHVITFGKDGAVVIAPTEGKPHRVSVTHLPAHQTEVGRRTIDQLGCGDILTAISAMEFVAGDATPDPAERMTQAVQVATWVVASYLQMSWGQMPRRDDMRQLKTPVLDVQTHTEISATERWLPVRDIDLKDPDVRTEVPPLISVDKKYRDTLRGLLETLKRWRDPAALRSLVLTAQGGSGKSQICEALPALLTSYGIQVRQLPWGDPLLDLQKASRFIDQIRSTTDGSEKILLVIDEAFKHAGSLLFFKEGVLLLDGLHRMSVRLLMIDADFPSERQNLSESQFLSRCDLMELPRLVDRPADIPYVFLAGCARGAQKLAREKFACERRVLRAVIDFTLSGSGESPRTINNQGREAFERAVQRAEDNAVVELRHLDEAFRRGTTDSDVTLISVKC